MRFANHVIVKGGRNTLDFSSNNLLNSYLDFLLA
jgi:hypothetical protein